MYPAEPEVQTYTLTSEDEFLVLACDGLWDVMSSQRCMELARTHLRDNNNPQQCAEHLVSTAMSWHLPVGHCLVLLPAQSEFKFLPPPTKHGLLHGVMPVSGAPVSWFFAHSVPGTAPPAVQVQSSLDMKSVDNVTAMVVCFSKDPPPARLAGRSASRGPSRSLSRECLSTLSSALLDAQCQPAGLGAKAAEPREGSE